MFEILTELLGYTRKLLPLLEIYSARRDSQPMRDPATQELMAGGLLLPVKKSSRRVEGFPLVLEQPLMPAVTFPFEWPASMFKAAAIASGRISPRSTRREIVSGA